MASSPLQFLVLLATSLFASTGSDGAPLEALDLPPIVFVSRQPAPGSDPSIIPGLGPHHRTIITGGRLMIRRSDGTVHDVLPTGTMYDVSDPSISFDGERIAFAGVQHPDSSWRIWMSNLDGTGLRRLTYTDRHVDLSQLGEAAPRFERYDDFDPTWTADHLVCFASTRYPMIAQYADVPVSNLYLVHVLMKKRSIRLRRLTSERNGAEEPTVDHENSRIVFSRWWFNRHLASNVSTTGLTTAASETPSPDSANVWHAMEMFPLEGIPPRMAAGSPLSRLASEAYQPAVLADGSLVGVFAANLGLSPDPIATGLHRFTERFDDPEHLIGAAVEADPSDPYAEAGGLAAPSACSPAPLPDGRILFSWAPGARGDFGLYVMNADGSDVQQVLDMTGTLELDAAVVTRRRVLKTYQEQRVVGTPAPEIPIGTEADMLNRGRTFRFQCLNLFGGGIIDSPIPDPVPIANDLRIRFFALLSRPGIAGGDTAVLVREEPVGPRGLIDVRGLPADVPMFEQVVDANGDVVTSPHGGFMKSAHVAGANAGSPPYVATCVGCHVGHSTIVRDETPRDAEWFNASTSASVEGSSTAEGADARAVVDRSTRGPARDVAWIAQAGAGESVKLQWQIPIEVGAVVLYNLNADPESGTNVVVNRCEVILRHKGRKVGHRVLERPLSPQGTRLELNGRKADEIEVRVMGFEGLVERQAVAALAEIETIARLPRR